MAKEIIINFKLNGIETSIKDVDTLNNSVGKLEDKFEDTEKIGSKVGEGFTESVDDATAATGGLVTGIDDATDSIQELGDQGVPAMESVSDSTQDVADNVTNVTNNFSDAGTGVSDFSDSVNENLGGVNDTIVDLGTNINDVSNNVGKTGAKTDQFGKGLEKTTKSAAQAVGGLADGLELVGVQGESLDKLSQGFRTISELMKIQELLSIKAFGSQSILEQLKALGGLQKAQKASIVLTEAQATASGAQAAATTGAATATRGLSAALTASPLGPFLILIGAAVAAYAIFSESVKGSTEEINKQIDAFEELNKLTEQTEENFIQLSKIENTNQTNITQKRLDLLVLQNGSISEQEKLVKKLNSLKEEGLNIELKDKQQEKVRIQEEINIKTEKYNELLREASSLSGEEETKNLELAKQLDSDINDLGGQLLKNDQERRKISDTINIQKEFGNKLTEEEFNIKRKQLEQRREELALQVEQNKLENNKSVNDIVFEVDLKKLETDLEYAKSLVDRFLNSKPTEQIDFFGDIDTSSFEKIATIQTDIIKRTSELELSLVKKSEQDKQAEYLKTIKDKIQSSEQILKYENKSAAEIKLIQKDIAQEISAQSQNINSGYKESIIEREAAIESFNKKVVESTNVTKEQLQNILNASSEDEEISSFIENEKIRTQTVVTGIQSQIEVNNDLLSTTTLAATKRKELEEENIKLIEQSTSIQTTSIDNIDKAQTQYFDNLTKKIKEVSQENQKLTFSQQLSSEVETELSKVVNTYEENYSSIEKSQNELNEALQDGNILRIGLALTEFRRLKQESKKAGDEAIAEAGRIKNELTDKLNEKAEQDKSSGIFDPKQFKKDLKTIEDGYEDVVDGVDDNNKRLNQSFKDAAANIVGQIGMIADAALGLAQALTDLSEQRTEQQIQEIEDGFELMSEKFDEESELRQEALDAELEQVQEQQSAKLSIIQAAQTEIDRLEGQLQGARGNRAKYLLGLIDTERKRKADAQKEAAKLAEKEKQLEQQKLDDQKKRDEEKVRLEEEKEAKIEALRKRQFEKQKKMDTASAIIKGALAVITTLATTPYPASIALAALQAAAVAVEVASINEQTYAEGGELESNYMMVDSSGKLVNYKARGGEVQGPSHDAGGVRGTGAFNNVEVEGGEFIVRKEATRKNKKEIEKINSNPDKEFVVVEKSVAEKSNISEIDSPSKIVNNFSSTDRVSADVEREKEAEFMASTKTILREFGGMLYPANQVRLYETGGVMTPAPGGELIPAISSFNRTFNEVSNIAPNFELFESSLASNQVDTQAISQAIQEGMSNVDISVSVVDINEGQARVAKIKDFTSTR